MIVTPILWGKGDLDAAHKSAQLVKVSTNSRKRGRVNEENTRQTRGRQREFVASVAAGPANDGTSDQAPVGTEPVGQSVRAVLAAVQKVSDQLVSMTATRLPPIVANVESKTESAGRHVRFESDRDRDRDRTRDRARNRDRDRTRDTRASGGTRPAFNAECFHCKGPHFLRACPTFRGCDKCGSKTHTTARHRS